MKPTITQTAHHFLKNFLLTACFFFISCQSEHVAQEIESGVRKLDFKTYRQQKLSLPTGRLVTAFLAESDQQQTQGLSGVMKSELQDHEGMLFVYPNVGPRRFWMPNTFINLDIIFMDQNYKVVYIERSVVAHPGMKVPPAIAQTKIAPAQYVLELKDTSSFSQSIKVGDTLRPLN